MSYKKKNNILIWLKILNNDTYKYFNSITLTA